MLNHAIHANAIATSGVWRIAQLSSTEVGVTSFWVLNFMWLKFLVIWRFFRSWALLDGVETPENISRCVYSYWRFWQRCKPPKSCLVNAVHGAVSLFTLLLHPWIHVPCSP